MLVKFPSEVKFFIYRVTLLRVIRKREPLFYGAQLGRGDSPLFRFEKKQYRKRQFICLQLLSFACVQYFFVI